ncbi:MAG: catalase [Planctomycetota bacterium]
MVHALKPNPKTHLQEDWRILDFFSHHPEALHMFTFLFDDVGIPSVSWPWSIDRACSQSRFLFFKSSN